MKLKFIFLFIVLSQLDLSCVDAKGGGGRSSGGRRGGGFLGLGRLFGGGSKSHSSSSHSSGSSYPYSYGSSHSSGSSPSHSYDGSNPHTIGWNVPSHNYHPSAPLPDPIRKSTVTNYHSSYGHGHNRDGAFGKQSNHNNYSPSAPYPPSGSSNYNPTYGHYGSQGYSHVPAPHYNPPVGAYAQPQTIFIQSQAASKPSLGQLAKEAAVNSIVDTAVKASVNRILPGGIYGHHYHSHSYGGSHVIPNNEASGSSNTHITYNNYYGNNSPAEASSGDATQTSQTVSNSNLSPSSINHSGDVTTSETVKEELKFTSPSGQATFKHEIESFTSQLFINDNYDALGDKYIKLNLQELKTDDSITDSSPEKLLTVENLSFDSLLQMSLSDMSSIIQYTKKLEDFLNFRTENPGQNTSLAYNIPTIKALLPLHDNYVLDASKNETVTDQQRDEESRFIDAITNTTVMNMTMNFLVLKGYVSDDRYAFKNALKEIWFTRFQRVQNASGSSGFEYAFLAEKINGGIIGLHNWIYYVEKEKDEQLNYLGYIGHTSLHDKAAFVKVRSRLNDTASNVTTLFIGLSPEMEMSLYTLCFYISPWYPCPIKLADKQFNIFVTRHRYFDKDILVSADIDLHIPPPPPPPPPPPTTTTPSPSSTSTTTIEPLQRFVSRHYYINREEFHGSSASAIHSLICQFPVYFLSLLIIMNLF